jgi:polyisoprenyl-teichoic acid--peptidoglycan teichoic acid transferase
MGRLILFLLVLGVYLLYPARSNVLIMGVDRTPQGTDVGRTDTLILTSIQTLSASVGMLSVPRDLWVTVPGFGENRINTAHFFAEADLVGSGPAAAILTVQSNFGVDVDYFLRIKFDGVVEFVNALGGLDLELEKSTGGLPAGPHHLAGDQALAFIRDRSGTDDFFRMQQGQFFIKALLTQVRTPGSWLRIPGAVAVLLQALDTNIPFWQIPRLGAAVLRAGADGIDARTITRDQVNPFTTSSGANVLAPDWALINPVLLELFGQ